jgi:hypothetical protein
MIQGKTDRAAQELFRSISDDGTQWMFVVMADNGWAITRNGDQVIAGGADRASIDSGVQRFLSLTAPVAGRLGLRPNVTKMAVSA